MESFGLRGLLVFCAVIFSFGCVGQATPRPSEPSARSFKECVERGGSVLKSFPAQCITPDGTRFVEDEGRKPRVAERACKDLCGNGQCEEIVCMAVGCPCPESPQSCPQDCKE